MKLISLKDQNLDGDRKLKKGDKFTMSDASGRFLIATKRAILDTDDDKPPKRKTYSRRDLNAED